MDKKIGGEPFFLQLTRPGDSYWSLTKLTSQKDPGSFLLPLQFSRSFARDRAERRTILENDHNSAEIFCLLRRATRAFQIRYGGNSLTFAVGIYRFIYRVRI